MMLDINFPPIHESHYKPTRHAVEVAFRDFHDYPQIDPARVPPHWSYLHLRPWQEKITDSARMNAYRTPYLTPPHLSLADVIPIHGPIHFKGVRGPIEYINDVRARILLRLTSRDWERGGLPSKNDLVVILSENDQGIPVVSRRTNQGKYLLLNGHHRLITLATLVTDGLLPRETLLRLPFNERDVSSVEILQDAGIPYPNFSWIDAVGFHPPTQGLMVSLGATHGLHDIYQPRS